MWLLYRRKMLREIGACDVCLPPADGLDARLERFAPDVV
jgi:hypothetical protein